MQKLLQSIHLSLKMFLILRGLVSWNGMAIIIPHPSTYLLSRVDCILYCKATTAKNQLLTIARP